MMISLLNSVLLLAAEPKAVSGTKNMLQELQKYILVIVPILAGVYCAYHYGKQLVAEDQADIQKHKKCIKNGIFAAIGSFCIGGIITWVLAFYK